MSLFRNYLNNKEFTRRLFEIDFTPCPEMVTFELQRQRIEYYTFFGVEV